MLRNVASQKYRVYAWDATTGLAKTGDASNISAHIRKDDAASAATNDVDPTEASSTNEPGYYDFDLTQAETDAAKVSLAPKSSTANIQVVACPPVVYTRPQYSSLLGIASDGDLTKVNTLDGHTAQTGDSYAIVNSGTHGNAALKTLIDTLDNFVDTEITEILTRIGTPAVSLTADLATIEAQTDDIGVAGAGLTAIPWNASWDAEVESEANDALVAQNLDHLVKIAVDSNFATTVHLDSVIGQLADNGTTATFDRTTDSLEALQGTSAPSAATIADAVWDEALAGHLSAGSTGEALNAAGSAGDPWTTTLPGAYTGSQAGKILADILVDTGTTLQGELDALETDIDTILTRIGVPSVSLTSSISDIDTDISGLVTSVAALNDFDPTTDKVFLGNGSHGGSSATLVLSTAVIQPSTGDALTLSGGTSGAGLAVIGSGSVAGYFLGNASNAGLELIGGSGGAGGHALTLTRGHSGADDLHLTNSDAPTLASAVWAGATRTLTALDEDTVTLDLDNTIRAALGIASANLDTQLAKLDTIDNFLDTEITEILTRIGVPASSLTADIAALNDISAADVNAQVVDALSVDTYAEPTGVPTATVSLSTKIGRMYKALMRGIEVTATEKRFLDSAGASEWKKTLSDDGTTYEETSALAP